MFHAAKILTLIYCHKTVQFCLNCHHSRVQPFLFTTGTNSDQKRKVPLYTGKFISMSECTSNVSGIIIIFFVYFIMLHMKKLKRHNFFFLMENGVLKC